MLGEELSKALGDISDDKIAEAAELAPVRRRVWPRWVAAAAVVALILTIALWPREEEPGAQIVVPTVGTSEATVPTDPAEPKEYELVKLANAMKMYSYDQGGKNEDELERCEVMDTLDHFGQFWIETVYPQYGIRFSFDLPEGLYGDAKIKITLSSTYGEFYVKDNETGERVSVGKSAEIELGEMVTWRPECDLQQLKENVDPGELYLHVIIYADGNIVGFGVVEMAGNYILDRSYYAVTLRRFRTFCYPLVDETYQTVTEEHIMGQIAECEKTMHEDFEAWLEDKAKELEEKT